MTEERRPRRFTVDEYEAMGRAGILHEDERVELIRGVIVEMPPIGGPQMWSVNRGTERFVQMFAGRAYVSVQNPIRLSDSEPQPDLVLVSTESLRKDVPGPDDVLLVLEIADSSLRYDLGEKVAMYADDAISEVWVLDVDGEQIHVFRDPRDGAYATTFVVGRGDTVAPVAFPDVEIAPEDLLP